MRSEAHHNPVATTVRTGVVAGATTDSLHIQFASQRCANCNCGFSLLARTTPDSPGTAESSVTDNSGAELFVLQRAWLPDDQDTAVQVGQAVSLAVASGRFSAANGWLFGLPVLTGLFGCAGALVAGWPESAQAAAVLAGFALGAGLAWLRRQRMQTSIYESLALKPIDC